MFARKKHGFGCCSLADHVVSPISRKHLTININDTPNPSMLFLTQFSSHCLHILLTRQSHERQMLFISVLDVTFLSIFLSVYFEGRLAFLG